MKSMLLVASVILFFVNSLPSQTASAPSAEAVRKADTLVADLYHEELARAEKEPGGLARLAGQFLQEARETSDYPAGRVALLDRAVRMAVRAGDVATALQAIDEKLHDQKVPAASPVAVQQKVAILLEASKYAGQGGDPQTLVDMSLVLLEDALEANDFATSQKLLAVAESAGLQLKSVALVSGIRRRQDDVKRAERVFEQWRPFFERLVKDPTDAEASSQVGRYLALVKGNWEAGLPLLSRGNDKTMRELAARDLKNPTAASEQFALGEGYVKLAAATPELLRPQVTLRAYHWLQGATSAAINDSFRKRAQELMDEVLDTLPPEYRVGEIVSEWKSLEGHQGPAYAADFSPDGKRAISVGADGSLRLWDVKTGKETRRLDGHTGRLWTVDFAGDGRRVVSGGFDGGVRLWDLLTGREVRRLGSHGDYVRSVRFSADGHFVVSAGDDKCVRLWNADTGKEIATIKGHDHFVWNAVLSRDNARILSGSLDRTARLWDAKTGNELLKLAGHADTVLAVDLSPDGRRALTGSTDQTIKLWDLDTGAMLKTFHGHTGYVHSVSISPDGRRALSAGADKTIRLWDLATGKELRVLTGHRDQVWSIVFARDGRLALSAGQDGVVRVWGGRER